MYVHVPDQSYIIIHINNKFWKLFRDKNLYIKILRL